MSSPFASSRRSGFTLIELLVVISIIIILAGLLFPAVQGALENAKKVQAKNDATNIANAITAYMTEYGKLPTTATGDVDSTANTDEVMNAIGGTDATLNPRKTTFLEIPNAKNKKNGRDQGTGPYLDPWGTAYFISLDANYDEELNDPVGGSTIRKTVLVWSQGNPSKTKDYQDKKKWITSW